MNRKQLIKEIAERNNFTQEEVKIIFDDTFEIIKEKLFFGMNVAIRDFAYFKIKESPSREFFVPSKRKKVRKPKRFNISVTMSEKFIKKVQSKTIYDGNKV